MLRKVLDCVFTTRFDPGYDTWSAIKVYRDGNPIVIKAGFATEEEAEEAARVQAEVDRLRNAIMEIKALVCGDKVPNWIGDHATFKTRFKIADLCDLALQQ